MSVGCSWVASLDYCVFELSLFMSIVVDFVSVVISALYLENVLSSRVLATGATQTRVRGSVMPSVVTFELKSDQLNEETHGAR